MIIKIKAWEPTTRVAEEEEPITYPSFVMVSATPEGDLNVVFDDDGETVSVPLDQVSLWTNDEGWDDD